MCSQIAALVSFFTPLNASVEQDGGYQYNLIAAYSLTRLHNKLLNLLPDPKQLQSIKRSMCD